MSPNFLPYEIIFKKRNGRRLDRDEIEFMVGWFTRGDIPDYQMAAFLMAVFFHGMDDAETAALTQEMMASGEVLDLHGRFPVRTVDKHSTGGVGDKVSLPLTPAVAACGVPVPMMSGRGLGHTGGTLDKLESIPGFRTNLSKDEFVQVLSRVGGAIIGQTDKIAPADRKMYALRDVTATVDCIPLIAASILSKKLAAGPEALVLDVKTGHGAFMQTLADSKRLARAMLGICRKAGRPAVCFITDMEQPLGRAIGNALEIRETIECLSGEGPADLRELVVTFGAEMLKLAGRVKNSEEGRKAILTVLSNGQARRKFAEIVEAQGGDPKAIDDPARLPAARHVVAVEAPKSGVVQRLAARDVGVASLLLGAGRTRASDKIDFAAGIVLAKKTGDRVKKGEPVAWLHAGDPARIPDGRARFLAALKIGAGRPKKRKLIWQILK
ncbi:MAG: hypothetical protein A3I06_09095 [Candidatus Lindowbacteria bacterium RIFCSPLOWO2_02_FULL_62_12]|nr:MAG: hypothetical protein A3I06_09095 [Candidatus Lindowbacteria bacterium RIFCSPLOWO2_02_FULL_62_12]